MLDGCSALTIKNRESASAIPIPVSSPKTGLSTFTPRVCQDLGREVQANQNTLKINVPNHTARWSVLREPEERVPSAHAARPSGPRSTPHRPTQLPHVTIQENRNGRDDARCAVDPATCRFGKERQGYSSLSVQMSQSLSLVSASEPSTVPSPMGRLAAIISQASAEAASIRGETYIFFILLQHFFTVNHIDTLLHLLHTPTAEVIDHSRFCLSLGENRGNARSIVEGHRNHLHISIKTGAV